MKQSDTIRYDYYSSELRSGQTLDQQPGRERCLQGAASVVPPAPAPDKREPHGPDRICRRSNRKGGAVQKRSPLNAAAAYRQARLLSRSYRDREDTQLAEFMSPTQLKSLTTNAQAAGNADRYGCQNIAAHRNGCSPKRVGESVRVEPPLRSAFAQLSFPDPLKSDRDILSLSGFLRTRTVCTGPVGLLKSESATGR